MKRIECNVLGKVRGVGFRAFTVRCANSLWLSGFVRNTGSGEVSVVAEGEEEALRVFVERLRKGPFLARVRDVLVEWKDATGEYKRFTIEE